MQWAEECDLEAWVLLLLFRPGDSLLAVRERCRLNLKHMLLGHDGCGKTLGMGLRLGKPNK